jgi:hypothetical protein
MPTLNDVLAGSLAQAVNVQQIIAAMKGTTGMGVPVSYTSLNDPNNYALTVRNLDPTNSRALSVLKADGTSLITADATGVTLAGPVNLPVGSVTSAMILDGTVATVDIAANAVQQNLVNYTGTPSAWSTGGTGTWVETTHKQTFTSGGGLLRIEMSICLQHTAAGASVFVGVGTDDALQSALAAVIFPAGSNIVTASMIYYATLAAALHSAEAFVYNNTTGTVSINGSVSSSLYVTEQKR